MALEYAKLPNDPEELKQLLLQHSTWVDALREEVIRLRRWRFGRSSEVIDLTVLPELPLSGGMTAPSPAPQPASDGPPPPPRLVSVDAPVRKKGMRRPPRLLPPELPRVIRVHQPPSCDCPGWTRRCKNGQRTCKHTRSVDMHTADEQCVRTVRYVKGVGVKPPVLQQGELKMKVRHFDFTE